MPKSPTYKTSAVEFDGAMPLAIATTEITYSATTTQYGVKHLVPWGCSIQKLYLQVRTASTLTTLFWTVGTMANLTKFMASTRLDASSAGLFDLTSSLSVTAVDAGDVFTVTFTSGGTAVVNALAILNPNI